MNLNYFPAPNFDFSANYWFVQQQKLKYIEDLVKWCNRYMIENSMRQLNFLGNSSSLRANIS